jgi:hypothetical protein
LTAEAMLSLKAITGASALRFMLFVDVTIKDTLKIKPMTSSAAKMRGPIFHQSISLFALSGAS